MDRTKSAAVWLLTSLACLAPAIASADGWHNAVLTSSSLDGWLSDVKQAIPDVIERLDSDELVSGQGLEALRKRAKQGGRAGGEAPRSPRRAGTIDSELTSHQQALLGRKAGDCLEALAFMRPDNILIEFPDFPVDKIPQYRETAAKLLRMMGRPGAIAVAGDLRSSLLGVGRAHDAAEMGIALCDDYYEELLKILKAGGDRGLLSPKEEHSLRVAASGAKSGLLAELSRKVLDMFKEFDANLRPLPEWLEFLKETRDAFVNRNIQGRIRARMPAAGVQELLDFLQAEPPGALRQAAIDELERRFAKASVLELLRIQAEFDDAVVDRRAAAELAGRSPRYAEVKDDLAGIIKFAADDASPASDAARRQVANAFQRAPMREALFWLGKVAPKLQALVWRQVDGRIARADRSRRALYRDAAIESLEDKSAGREEQLAACKLLERLDASLVVGPLADALPRLPRELWPRAGDVLHQLTGQDFGPHAGDGVAELIRVADRWRKWVEQQPDDSRK